MLENYESSLFTRKLNFRQIPVTLIDSDDKGMETFNKIMEYVESCNLNHLVRTPSGGISTDRKNWCQFPGYDVRTTTSCIELTIIDERCYRFQFRSNFFNDKNEGVSGSQAFFTFRKICESFGVDITKFHNNDIVSAKSIKMQIPPAIIDLTTGWNDIEIPDNVHHIDIHSAHMAGVAFAFPELLEPIKYCFKNRKTNPVYKAILTHSWGYFQSQYSPVYYGYSHLSKAGIEYTNSKIEELTKTLTKNGRIVLMHNTDGIWYSGDIYHGEGEGDDLGQWSNDYYDCRFRAKSKGIYEFEGYDKHSEFGYRAVARGRYELDKVKPRKDWVWGDIYHTGKCLGYTWNKDLERIEKYNGKECN